MHTYLKIHDREYDVGMWLPGIHDGRTEFVKLFTVRDLEDALYAVNFLNGGSSENYDKFQIYKEAS